MITPVRMQDSTAEMRVEPARINKLEEEVIVETLIETTDITANQEDTSKAEDQSLDNLEVNNVTF